MKKQSKTCEQSRRNLIEAFLKVYPQKPLEKISIKDITDIAGYNRSTFYLYFKDIYDLADAAENDLLELLCHEVNSIIEENPKISLPEFMSGFAARSSEFAGQIYIFSDSKAFKGKMQKMVSAVFAQVNDVSLDNEHFDFVISLVFSIMLHNLNYWYQHNDTMTLQETIELCKQIVSPGIQQFVNKRGMQR